MKGLRDRRLALAASGLAAALLLAGAAARERSRLRAEALAGAAALADESAGAARDSIIARDPLLLFSRLMSLRRDHAELAYAGVTRDGHLSELGAAEPGFLYIEREARVSGGPSVYTVTAPAGAASVTAGPGGLSLRVSGNAKLRSSEPPAETVALRLGFSRAELDRRVARGLRAAAARAALAAAPALAFGFAAALFWRREDGAPLPALPAPPAPLAAAPPLPAPAPRIEPPAPRPPPLPHELALCSLTDAVGDALVAETPRILSKVLDVVNYAVEPLVARGEPALARAAVADVVRAAVAAAAPGAPLWLGAAKRGDKAVVWASYRGAAPDVSRLAAAARRAAGLGGRVRVETIPDAGAALFVELPLGG